MLRKCMSVVHGTGVASAFSCKLNIFASIQLAPRRKRYNTWLSTVSLYMSFEWSLHISTFQFLRARVGVVTGKTGHDPSSPLTTRSQLTVATLEGRVRSKWGESICKIFITPVMLMCHIAFPVLFVSTTLSTKGHKTSFSGFYSCISPPVLLSPGLVSKLENTPTWFSSPH